MNTLKTPLQSLANGRRSMIKGSLAAAMSAPFLLVSNRQQSHAAGIPQALPVEYTSPQSSPADMDSLFELIKRTASNEALYKFLYSMPKGGDIHHHLGGGFLPDMWMAIATDMQRNGGQIFYTRYRITSTRRHPLLSRPGVSHIFLWQTLNEKHYQSLDTALQSDFKAMTNLTEAEQAAWKSSVVLDVAGEGRDEFFEYHWSRLWDLSRSIHVITELFVENMKLFGAEGTRYLEIQRGAMGYRDPKGELIPSEIAEAYWKDRLAQPDAVATGVKVRWQGVVIRFAPNAEDLVREWFAFIDQNRDTWVGLNMAGREDNNKGYPSRFTKVYDEMLRKYPRIGQSIHAGESEKPDSNIRDTLRLGATRIGHGINLIWDEDTLLRMRDSRFLVEINLISNELLDYVPDLDQHPFPVYLRQGVPCCLNTDDRGMWDTNFTDEFYVAVKRFNLSWDELKTIAYNSFEHSFAEASLKSELVADYESRLSSFEAQFSQSNWQSVVAGVPAITHGYGVKNLGLKL
ncbi:MAG: adenosine deaminase [Verrucomicrobiota bacterium]